MGNALIRTRKKEAIKEMRPQKGNDEVGRGCESKESKIHEPTEKPNSQTHNTKQSTLGTFSSFLMVFFFFPCLCALTLRFVLASRLVPGPIAFFFLS